MKILNLYAGIGGNRKLWGDEQEITAVEINSQIAKIYQEFFPNDKVIVDDAHKYLLEHYKEFDFIWSSPPCPTHSKITMMASKSGSYDVRFPDMKLYEEIIFLKHFFNRMWVVENVIGYYKPLIRPFISGRHYFWSNFIISNIEGDNLTHNERGTSKIGFDLSDKDLNHRKDQILRNCVDSRLGLHIFNCAFKEKQMTLHDSKEKRIEE